MLDARYRKFGIKMRGARYKMLIKTALHDRYRRIEGGKSLKQGISTTGKIIPKWGISKTGDP